jgi:hypothetical protein
VFFDLLRLRSFSYASSLTCSVGAWDRFVFGWLYRFFPSILSAITIIKPETVIGWHRDGFRSYWRWKSRLRWTSVVRTVEIRRLIRQDSWSGLMSRPI